MIPSIDASSGSSQLEAASDVLDYPFALGPLGTPPEIIHWARKHRPVCPIRLPSGRRAWMITRSEEIDTVLSDARFSRDLVYPGAPRFVGDDFTSIPGGIFNLDPPDHTRVRHVIGRFYTRAGVAGYQAIVERHADRLLDAMAAGPNPVDLMDGYSTQLPLRVSSDVLGVPAELRGQYLDYFRTQTNYAASRDDMAAATSAIVAFVREVIDNKRADRDRDGPVGALIDAQANGAISADELLGTVCYLFVTGSEPLIPPISTGVLTLLVHASQLRQCLARPELWPGAVEEVLRYHHNGVLGMPRVATEDVRLNGVTIRRGEAVCATMLGPTWDPRHYRNPAKFDIHRRSTGSLTFGGGPHFCLGAAFTRMFVRTAYERLFTRFPTLALAMPAEYIPWQKDILFIKPAALPVAW